MSFAPFVTVGVMQEMHFVPHYHSLAFVFAYIFSVHCSTLYWDPQLGSHIEPLSPFG